MSSGRSRKGGTRMISNASRSYEIETPEFFTKFGVPIVVDGIAPIKVRSEDPVAVATAAEMFLSKSANEMNEIARQMMQGHLRAVISTMPLRGDRPASDFLIAGLVVRP